MKKLLFLCLAVFALSCTDNDDNIDTVVLPVNQAGTMTINGGAFPLMKGYIIPPTDGSNPDFNPRRFYIILTDGDVAAANGDLIYGDNIHQLIDFNLYTSAQNPGSVQQTSYNLYIPDSGFDMDNPFIDHTSINTNVVLQNGQFISGADLDSDDMDNGQATISFANGMYTVAFAFSNNGNLVTGNFTGPLTVLNPN